ncbi:MAG: hypothetical protein JXB62_00145 [Pirellulales bacterium]|nr:hypothetical protein [Pirellulales bacterium]
MAEQLDVYRDWLGIAETARPLDYYQLLRLKRFADDRARIRDHYRKMNAHVRKFATGDYSRQSQELLNELAKAMLCLTDQQRKREYDASLGRKDEEEGRRRSLEEILLGDKAIDRLQLEKARSYANAIGLDVRDALVQQKMASADVVMLAYAESLGLPYVELEDVGVDEALVPQIPPKLARRQSCVPVMIDGDYLLMAAPNPLVPDVEEELRLRFEMPIRTVLCTAASVNVMIAKYYPREGAESAAAPAKQPAAKKQERKEKKPAAAKPPRPALSEDEKTKRRGMVAVLAFNLTVILSILVCIIFRGGMAHLKVLHFGIALVLATMAAAAAFAITMWWDK